MCFVTCTMSSGGVKQSGVGNVLLVGKVVIMGGGSSPSCTSSIASLKFLV